MLYRKKERQRGCMYGKGKGHVRTVYSQMNESVTGEEKSCQKTKIKGDQRV